MFKKATFSPSQPRPAETRLSTGKAAGLWRTERTREYVSTTKGRSACLRVEALRREAAFSLRSHFGEVGPADRERRWPVGRNFSEGWPTFSTFC